MTYQLLFFLSYSLISSIGIYFEWKQKAGSPIFWYVVFQWIMYVGTLVQIDVQSDSDLAYLGLFHVALLGFIFSSTIFSQKFEIAKRRRDFQNLKVLPERPEVIRRLIFVAVISMGISLLYYYLLGYNVLLDLFAGIDDEYDYSSKRLAAYSGQQYLAPGYVNQFKNVLLPLSLSILIWTDRKRKSKFKITYYSLLILISVILILGTGQRAFLVYAFGAYLFGLTLFRRMKQGKIFIAGGAVLIIFTFLTLFYKNSTESKLDIFVPVLERFFVVQQEGGLEAFDYIYSQDITWFKNWFEEFRGVLPQYKGSNLAHIIHFKMYGTMRGTVPPSLVGSAYYNGGWLGVFVSFIFIGWVYSYLMSRMMNGPKNISRLMIYGALFFYLATFVAGSPVSLINNGMVALMLLLLILKVKKIKHGR